MPRYSSLKYCIAMLTAIRIQFISFLSASYFCSLLGDAGSVQLESSTPTYCIDPAIYEIVRTRAAKCFVGGSAQGEFSLLKNLSVADHHRSHEILAYQYFVENKNNIHRRSCAEADFEYIPLLPLSWRSGYPSSTTCTAGGYCPRLPVVGDPSCSMISFITDLLSIVKHVQTVRGQNINDGIPKFSVTSAYNLRTMMAFGLPSAARSGAVHSSITSFVTSTYLGHYERQPQCPDVLRKQWRFLVEIPFVSLSEQASRVDSYRLTALPQRVCSVRHAIATQLSHRIDTTVLNISESQAYGPAKEAALEYLTHSSFCLVTRADSYSSAFFYDALQAGCIPIVISDWFVFAFPSVIPYAKFVIRIEEEIFLKNPHTALDEVKSQYPPARQVMMRQHMADWVGYLSYSPQRVWVNATSPQQSTSTQPSSTKLKKGVNVGGVGGGGADIGEVKGGIQTVVPFELMLREMRHHHHQAALDLKATQLAPKKKNAPLSPAEIADVYCYSPHTCSTRVPPLQLTMLNDTRGYMCANRARFMGRYKIVFFQQCVRILWPNTPGVMKPSDLRAGALTLEDQTFIRMFHNVSKNTTNAWYAGWTTYPLAASSKSILALE